MKTDRKPIRTKIQNMVLAISIAALIIASAVGVISMIRIQNDSEKALISQMEQDLRNITTNKADLAQSELGLYSSYVENLAAYITGLYKNPSGYVSHDVPTPKKEDKGKLVIQRTLRDKNVLLKNIEKEIYLLGNVEQVWHNIIKSKKGLITVIYLGTESGLMVGYDDRPDLSAEDGGDVYYDYSKSAWYTKAKKAGRVCFTDVYMDIYERGLMITCTAPFYDADNNFAGVVGMDILISDLYKNIIELDLGENAYAFLVDNNGHIIDNVNNDKAKSIYDEAGMNKFVASEILAGKTGVSLAQGETHYDYKSNENANNFLGGNIGIVRDNIYFAYAPIESTGWKFCARIPESVILAPVRSVQRNVIFTIILFLAAFVIIVAIVAIASRKFSKKLTSPIIALTNDVKEISGGNFDYRAQIHDNDEIGDLAKSFNYMAISLKDYIRDLAAVTAEKERIGAELNVATQIQADMLPRIFPPFPDRKEFEIYATMTPAKEVGGDFYDFFLINHNHLGLVMADVSGKGVPAALFMVIAKTLIKNRALMGGTPAEILHDVNNQLCEGNDAELFVTVWLGILEISTGKVISANAGHEYPAIKRADGKFELLKSKHSPAVATMEDIKFREVEFSLNKGDILYIYTDGVAEATNSADELYGTDRMIDALNKNADAPIDEILADVKKDVDNFTGDAPQFDDITMLGLRYYGQEVNNMEKTKKLEISAEVKNLDTVLAFVDEQLEKYGCTPKIQMQIDVAVEEIFVNIANYAYNPEIGSAGIWVEVQEDPLVVSITFTDNGVPYDPLKKPDPDVTLSAEERQIGGLGIYMVKKSMDDISYEYKDGKNILTIKKSL